MTSIDKAAIAFSIAIVAVGVGFAFFMGAVQDAGPVVSTPIVSVDAAAKMAAEKADAAAKMAAETISGPQNHTVKIPVGTSSPGCENSNSCFSPASITINAGDTVTWNNADTAAHTVTAGSPADGPSGVFDSSLVMAGADYAFTFNDKGSYTYFCMVHPWMTGSVTVN